jgi:hypothetical protein
MRVLPGYLLSDAFHSSIQQQPCGLSSLDLPSGYAALRTVNTTNGSRASGHRVILFDSWLRNHRASNPYWNFLAACRAEPRAHAIEVLFRFSHSKLRFGAASAFLGVLTNLWEFRRICLMKGSNDAAKFP